MLNEEIRTKEDISYISILAQLFKTNDVVSKRIVKTLIIKYGFYANIFCWKNVSSFCI